MARAQTVLVEKDRSRIALFGMLSTFLVYNDPGEAGDPAHNGFDPDAETFNFTTGFLPSHVGVTGSFAAGAVTVGADVELGIDPVGTPSLGSFGRVQLRQAYGTLDGPFGRILLGRAWAPFNLQSLVYDLSLIGVGRLDELTAGASSLVGPVNGPAFGHMGTGQLWNSHRAQLRYSTPALSGATISLAVMEPENVTADRSAGFASFAERRTRPRLDAEVSYVRSDTAGLSLHAYASGTYERVENPSRAGTPSARLEPYGVSGGVQVTQRRASLAVAGYTGQGLGQRIVFLEGVDSQGNLRKAHGFFVQAAVTPVQQTTLGFAYGQSTNQATSGTPGNVQVKGKAWTIHSRYVVSRHATLVGEYTRGTEEFDDDVSHSTDTVVLGGVFTF